MKGFAPIWILLIIIVSVGLLAGGYYLGQNSSKVTSKTEITTVPTIIPTISISNQNPTILPTTKPVVAQSDVDQIMLAIKNDQRIKSSPAGSQFVATNIKIESNWGVIDGELKPKLADEPMTFLVQKINNKWQVLDAKDSSFCQSLKSFPNSLLSETGKSYFADCD